MDVSLFSDRYLVRRLNEDDIGDILALCRKNTLYYQYCPPMVTEKSIACDMKITPPGKETDDKYYLGYFDKEKLIAILDLIRGFPDEDTAYIGFFMSDISIQGSGIGSMIIDDLCDQLKQLGFSYVKLGWVKGNPQAEHFWHKNCFRETGDTYDRDDYTIVIAKRIL